VQRSGNDLRLLRHAPAEFLNSLFAVVPQVEPFEGRFDSCFGLAASEAFERAQVVQAVGQFQVVVQAALFGHIADAIFFVFVNWPAEDLDCPAVGFEEIERHAEGGRLACAVGAEQAEDFAGRDGERKVGHGDLIAEGFGDGVY